MKRMFATQVCATGGSTTRANSQTNAFVCEAFEFEVSEVGVRTNAFSKFLEA